MSKLKIAFVGSGNLAWHLAPALDNAGFIVKEVYSRTPANADKLVDRLYQAQLKYNLDFSDSDISLVIISVADDAIIDVAKEIVLPENCIVAHTSGSQPLDVLEFAASQQIGVFYPLQTFSKTKKVDFRGIPIFIESQDNEVEVMLLEMAEALSKQVYKLQSGDRKKLHLAAVFACNFANHMLKVADDILGENNFDLTVLQPLINETISKALSIGPSQAQTGPAKRHDFEILDKHFDMLEYDESLQEIYKLLSQNIIDSYPKE